jgi:hypothetical protein
MARRLPTHDGDHHSLDSVPGPAGLCPLQAAAWRGTRTGTSVALGLRSVRSSCIVIDVSSWSAGRQASPGLCITASGWSASQEDRWIADGEGMEAKARSARCCEVFVEYVGSVGWQVITASGSPVALSAQPENDPWRRDPG